MKLSEQELLEAEKKLKHLSTELTVSETIKNKISKRPLIQRNNQGSYKHF